MPRINITGLPWPEPKYTPDLRVVRGGQTIYRESAAQGEAEDARRAQRIRSPAARAERSENRSAARSLARKLDYGSRKQDPPESCASSGYMREQCIKVAGAMWKLADELDAPTSSSRHGNGGGDPLIRTVSIMRSDWELSMGEFMAKSPSWFLERLRADLYRCGAGDAGGALIGGLHGEYAPHQDMMRVHGHFVLMGEMATVVDRLRKLPGYAPIVRHWEDRPRSTPAIRMSRAPLDNLPDPFTYIVQRFWPGRWEGLIDGKFKRSPKIRISEPAHTQTLIWLDRWSLKDLTLLVGIRATPRGLELTRSLYRNGSGKLPKRQG